MAAGRRQTALNDATLVVTSLINAGVVVLEGDEPEKEVLARIKPLADEFYADLESFTEERPDDRPQRRSGGGGGGRRSVSAEAAASAKFDRGLFNGKTIEEVYGLSKEEAAEFGYTGSGKGYITWLSKNDDWPYMRDRAKAFIQAQRAATSEDE